MRKDLVVGLLVAVVAVGLFASDVLPSNMWNSYPELRGLNSNALSFSEYEDFFENLAKEKGGVYAFQALLKADLAEGTDLHLLGHVVGDVLYKQKGLAGIHECTPDFRNACSHSIVVGLFTERGVEALDDIAEACSNAPGGSGAYTMCFHGLGHGILAYANYDFKQAVAMCKHVGTAARQHREYIECVGGVTMEMVAGVHDRNSWEVQYAHYFTQDDPLSPCNQSYVAEEVKPMCYTYLTPHLFEAAGADLANPLPEYYEKAFTFCDLISEKERVSRDACYGGFGKEFVVLAQGHDVRDVGSMDADALQKVRDWCALTPDRIGQIVCNGNALSSLFWGGENNPNASFLFCEIAQDPSLKGECYAQLSQMISYFLGNNPRAQSLCERLPDAFQKSCKVPR